MHTHDEYLNHRSAGRCECGGLLLLSFERGRFDDVNGSRDRICQECGRVWTHTPSCNWASLDEVHNTFRQAYMELVAQGVARPNLGIMANMVQLMIGKRVSWKGIRLDDMGVVINRDNEIIEVKMR